MKKVAGFSFDQEPEAEETGKLVFTVDSQEKIHKIFAQFGLSAAKDVTLHVNYGILEEDEEASAGTSDGEPKEVEEVLEAKA